MRLTSFALALAGVLLLGLGTPTTPVGAVPPGRKTMLAVVLER